MCVAQNALMVVVWDSNRTNSSLSAFLQEKYISICSPATSALVVLPLEVWSNTMFVVGVL